MEARTREESLSITLRTSKYIYNFLLTFVCFMIFFLILNIIKRQSALTSRQYKKFLKTDKITTSKWGEGSIPRPNKTL